MPELKESFQETEIQPQQDTQEKGNLLDKILGLNKEVDEGRRNFLKIAGVTGIALALTSCNSEGLFSFEKDNFTKNIEDLNNQFEDIKEQYLDEQGFFNYDRFKNVEGFQAYIPEIHTNCEALARESDIDPNALKLITSSIIATNLGNRQNISTDSTLEDVKNVRLGPMQFYAENVLNTLASELDNEYQYSPIELDRTYNIQFGTQHLLYGCLKNIKNDGHNQNLFELTLAQYYGGNNLTSFVKENREVPKDNFLKENYDLYVKTMSVMGINTTFAKSPEVGDIETEMDAVWERAVDYWSDSDLEKGRQYLYEQAIKYFNDDANEIFKLSKKEYLALFLSIVMTESYGGTILGPSSSNALGWFQVIPRFHLEDYYQQVQNGQGERYTEGQLRNDPEISIEVGAWALMRYRNSEGYQDIKKLMRMFKGGRRFGENWDDGIWWNRVTYCMTNLLGQDSLRLGYMDYEYPAGTDFKSTDFLSRPDHIGSINIEG